MPSPSGTLEVGRLSVGRFRSAPPAPAVPLRPPLRFTRRTSTFAVQRCFALSKWSRLRRFGHVAPLPAGSVRRFLLVPHAQPVFAAPAAVAAIRSTSLQFSVRRSRLLRAPRRSPAGRAFAMSHRFPRAPFSVRRFLLPGHPGSPHLPLANHSLAAAPASPP